MAIVSSLVDCVAEAVDSQRVLRVVLEVGALTAVAPDALRFGFDVCAKGTALEGAELAIEWVSALGRCRACDGEVELQGHVGLCHCGGTDIRVVRGNELRVREVEGI